MREFKLAAGFGTGVANLEVGVGENGKDDAELRDADAGRAESIDDEPGMGNPGDFRKYETAGHGDETGIVFAILDEEVVRGGIADNETSNDEDGGIGNSGENCCGRNAE